MNKDAIKIVLAEDDVNIRLLISDRLKYAGYEVYEAERGEDALRLINENNPDLAILDILMPPPNGLQVCRQVKADPTLEHIPVILLTAKSDESDRFWGMETGADAYITKPFDPDELLKKIRLFTRIYG
ncbi:MAG: response regulator [Elusimicrobiota bacterium]